MKLFLIALYFLIASLLLFSSDVGAKANNSQQQGYQRVSPNPTTTSERGQGYQRVTRNPNPPTTSERGSVVPIGDEYFIQTNIPRTCKICTMFKMAKINPDECIEDTNSEARQKCKDMVYEMPNTVAKAWKKQLPVKQGYQRVTRSQNPATTSERGSVVPIGDEYFIQKNIPRTCKICTMFKMAKINPDECIADANSEARQNCKDMVYEMPNTVAKAWKKQLPVK